VPVCYGVIWIWHIVRKVDNVHVAGEVLPSSRISTCPKDCAGNVDCDGHMKHPVPVKIQDSGILGCDTVLLG
jgi:hypothetical protein